MIRLDTINRKLSFFLDAGTTGVVATAAYNDRTASAFGPGVSALQKSNGATAVDLVAAPAASTTREIDSLTFRNTDGVSRTVTVQVNDTGTLYELVSVALPTQHTLQYVHGYGWHTTDEQGRVMTATDATVTDGDYGDVIVSGSGTVWSLDLTAAHAWTASQTFPNASGIKILDTNASNTLGLVVGSDLTADRTLTITTGDASRTLTLSGNATITGSNTGDQTITLTSDVTGSGTGSFATTIAANAVTDAKFRQSAGLSVVGRSANTTGNTADVTGTAGQVLRVSGTTLGFGAVDLTASAAVSGILGAANGGTGNGFTAFSGPATATKTFTLPNASATILTDSAAVTVAQGGTGAATLTAHAVLLGAGTSTLTFATIGTAGRLLVDKGAAADPAFVAMSGDATITSTGAITIASAAVTLAKIANAAASSKLLGSGATGSGAAYSEITLGTGLTMTGTTLSATSSGTVTSVSGTTNQVSVATGTTTPVISLTGPFGFTTQTSHGILLGAGTSAIAATAVMTDGQLLVGQSAADPLPKTISGNVTFSAAGAATLASIPANLGLRGLIDGVTLSTAGSSSTMSYAAGVCRDDTDAYSLVVSAGTKVLANTWASGSGSNGLDTGSVSTTTWYHVWVIAKADGTSVDVLFSLSATAPTMPSTYTLKRRVGSVFRNGSAVIARFFQDGDWFMWDTPFADIAATNPGTAAVTRTLTTPLGIQCRAVMGVGTYDSGVAGATSSYAYVSDLAATDVAASNTAFNAGLFGATSSIAGGCFVLCRTNTSSQVRSRVNNSTANTIFYITTLGWIDPRGKNL